MILVTLQGSVNMATCLWYKHFIKINIIYLNSLRKCNAVLCSPAAELTVFMHHPKVERGHVFFFQISDWVSFVLCLTCCHLFSYLTISYFLLVLWNYIVDNYRVDYNNMHFKAVILLCHPNSTVLAQLMGLQQMCNLPLQNPNCLIFTEE